VSYGEVFTNANEGKRKEREFRNKFGRKGKEKEEPYTLILVPQFQNCGYAAMFVF
jgi:hypothetical protein